jgi:hypothetical protein
MNHLNIFEEPISWEDEKKKNREFLKNVFNYLLNNRDLIKPTNEINTMIFFRYKGDSFSVMKSFRGIMEFVNEDEEMKMTIHLNDGFAKNDELIVLFNKIVEISKDKYLNERKKSKESSVKRFHELFDDDIKNNLG